MKMRLMMFAITACLCTVPVSALALEFEPYVTRALPDANSIAQSVAIGDVTGDGRTDLVVTSLDNFASYSVWVYGQQPDGHLTDTPVRYTVATPGNAQFGVTLGDLDRDGVLDIVAGHAGGVLVARGGAQAFTFTRMRSLLCGELVAVADVDRDGALDMIGHCVWPWAAIYYGDGSGGVAQVVYAQTRGTGFNDMEVADVSGDGYPDLVVTGGDGPARLAVAYNSPGYGYTTLPVQHWPGYQPVSLALGDFDGDGRTDAAIAESANSPDGGIEVFLQQANGRFGAASRRLTTYDLPGPMLATDLDGDGRNDLVVAHDHWEAVGYYLQSAGAWQDEVLVPLPRGNRYHRQGLATGDLNGDGRQDLVLAHDQAGLVLVYAKAPAARATQSPQRLRHSRASRR